ncbi:glycosyltransferase [Thalassospira sp. MA62]|nr:glycosyltransferase [Thalassospira sp. MA62]
MHIINELDAGGAERVLTRIASHNARQDGPRQMVVSLMGEGVYGSDLRKAGVALHCLGMTSGARDLPGAIWKLSRLINRHKPDAIMSWLYHSDFIATIATIISQQSTKRLAWNIRCAEMDLAQYGRSTKIVLSLLARLSRRPAVIAANSHAGQRHHIRCGYRPKRWAFLPNGFDTDEWNPDPTAKQRLCDEVGITAETKLIGMVARKDPAKDHESLITALGHLRAQGQNAHLILIGHDTTEIAVPDDLRDHVTALGLRRDVARLVPAFDVAVLSSSFGEGFPNVIGEAMSCGVPCVGNDVGDVADIMGESGITVPLCAPEKLATAIQTLLSEDEDANTLRRAAARQRIIDHYSLDAMNERYVALWEGVAGGRKMPDFSFGK